MAFSAAIEWDCRSTGADTNGGGFKRGASGTDWSLQNAAQYSVTDAVTAGTTTVTSATASFGTDVVGNVLYITGGTGAIAAGWYEITVRNSSTSITVDRSTGLTAGTGATLKIGGAFLTPSKMLSVQSGNVGHRLWLKNGSYTTSTLLSLVTNSGSPPNMVATLFSGYNVTHGDNPTGATRPTISCTGAGVDGFAVDTRGTVAYLILDGTSTARDGIVNTGYNGDSFAIGCNVTAFSSHGIGTRSLACEVTAMKSGAASGFDLNGSSSDHWYAYAHANPCHGFSTNGNNAGAKLVGCVAAYNTGASSDGFNVKALYGFGMVNCVSVGNGRHGLVTDTYEQTFAVINNVFSSNGGYGVAFNYNTGWAEPSVNYNAFYNNSSGARSNLTAGANDITLTGDPFVDAANGNFALNATAGAGAALKAAGFPGVFPGGLTTGYLDIGAVQHADPAGGAGLVGGGAGVGFARNRSVYF